MTGVFFNYHGEEGLKRLIGFLVEQRIELGIRLSANVSDEFMNARNAVIDKEVNLPRRLDSSRKLQELPKELISRFDRLLNISEKERVIPFLSLVEDKDYGIRVVLQHIDFPSFLIAGVKPKGDLVSEIRYVVEPQFEKAIERMNGVNRIARGDRAYILIAEGISKISSLRNWRDLVLEEVPGRYRIGDVNVTVNASYGTSDHYYGTFSFDANIFTFSEEQMVVHFGKGVDEGNQKKAVELLERIAAGEEVSGKLIGSNK